MVYHFYINDEYFFVWYDQIDFLFSGKQRALYKADYETFIEKQHISSNYTAKKEL